MLRFTNSRIGTFIVALPFLGSCAAIDGNGPGSPDSAVQRCSLPDGWAEVDRRQPRFVVFGEIHGTREAPEFIASVLCGLAAKGERVLLAIEHDVRENAALQTAWQAPESEFGALLLDAGWKGRDDGVGSKAMFSLLSSAHRLKENGHSMGVVGFNGIAGDEQKSRFASLEGQGLSEAAEAETIALAASDGDYDRVIVLVGSLHARTDMVERGNARFEPMARRLQRFGSTVTLEMRYGAGTSWSCVLRADFDISAGKPVGPEDVDCGIHPTRGNDDFDRPPFIEMYGPEDGNKRRSFDGFFWLGSITGSHPAAEPKERRQ